MNKAIKSALKFALVGALVSIPLVVLWHLYLNYRQSEAKAYYEKIKNNPKRYAYQILDKQLEPVFYITDLAYEQELIQFYDSLLAGNGQKINDISYGFPGKMIITPKDPLIVVGYAGRDSSLIEFVDFNLECYGYWRGYSYKKVMHSVLPPIGLIEKFNIDREKAISNSEGRKNFTNSQYGPQCD